jgi:Spy/CpxP family protein refolding chaperone
MSRIHLLAVWTMLMFASAVPAQQAGAKPGGVAKDAAQGSDLPDVGMQLKVLTEKLDLTGDQQPKVKNILQELHDATRKLVQEENMTFEQRLDKVRPLRMKADRQLREILSDEQKKKLDQYLQGPHSEMHGNLRGKTPPSTTPPQH